MAEAERMNPREREDLRRRGEPRRADAGLRSFGPRIGGAVMCPRCEGGGYVLGRCLDRSSQPYAAKELINQPVKCPVCNGEGLDPNAIGEDF